MIAAMQITDRYRRIERAKFRYFRGDELDNSRKWREEEEVLRHPRAADGKWIEADKPNESGKKKVKVSVEKMSNGRWYSMADLPNGQQITRSHADREEARKLAHADIKKHGFEPEEDEDEATAETPEEKPGVAVTLEKMPNGRWYAMADLPDGNLITRSHEDRDEALKLAHKDIRSRGFEPAEESAKPPAKQSVEPPAVAAPVESVAPVEPSDDDGYQAFKKKYENLLKEGFRYKPGEIGFQDFSEKAAKLSDEHPEWAERAEKEWEDSHYEPSPSPADRIESAKKNAETVKFRNFGDLPNADDTIVDETLTPQQEEPPHANVLATDGEQDSGRTEPGIRGTTDEESRGIAPGSVRAAEENGRPRSVPESSSELGGNGHPEHDRLGDGPDSGEGNRADGLVGAGAGGPEQAGGLGGGGSGRGHDSGAVAVSESLNEPASPENPTDSAAGNWRYHTRDFFAGGVKTKFKKNLEAIRTLRQISEEGRTYATPAEQEIISQFVGWGQMPGLFNEGWSYDKTWNKEVTDFLKKTGMSWNDWHNEKDKWTEERKQLKSLISESAWDDAKHATLNSHFTHPSIVDAHWKMAQRLGFKGGRFLEPSAGIGYYLGQMPPELAGKTHISAVEKDEMTGQLLKTLYPKSDVQVKGFEEFQAPDGFYDLIASNVPFGDYKLHEPRYNKHLANIHDHFFLKSADLAKPGGIIMHVTSTGTMDKQNDKIRQELAKTCDLVSAIRFPGQTHKENAGTDVVTDLVILRKRRPGEEPVSLEHTPPEAEAKEPGFTGTTTDSLGRVYHWVDGKRVPAPDWMSVKEVPDPDGGDPILVNAYFADHPEQILGRLDRTGEMRFEGQVNVSKTDDFEDRLQAAIDRLPVGALATDTRKQPNEPEQRAASDGVKDGGYVVHDGKIYRRDGGAELEQKVDKPTAERIIGQLAVRDARQTVVDAEIAGEPAEEARAELNRAYDAYVKKYGALSEKKNRAAMKGDPDAPNLLALEKWDSHKKTATKVDMFSKPTISAHKAATHADTVGEGVGISLHETGSIDVDRIAELTGKPKQDVEKELSSSGLAFDDPGAGWKPADQYLSGNVRKKLTMARAAAAADPRYQRNVEALEKVQPEDIDYQDIDVKLGASWVPPEDIQQFAAELCGHRPSDFEVSYIPETGLWQFHNVGGWSEATNSYGTGRRDFEDIMNAILNSKSLAVHDQDTDGKSYINQEETSAANDKAQEIREKFGDWIFADDERRERLHRSYNDNFNNIRNIEYNGSHQTFPGMNPDFKMRDLQKNFVWQVVTTGRGLAAHEVGTGKTASMLAAAMELRRLGLARKPCIACLKANIEQITKEALELYPGAKILSTNDKFDAQNRKRTIAQIATGDYDMVIMTHDHLDLLAMKPEVEQQYIRNELEELTAAKTRAWEADPKKSNRIVKQLESAKAKLEARLEKSIDSEQKDDAVYFEETGIDQLFVDEAHKYKNLPVHTHGERVKGMPTASSDRATNMHMRTQWLLNKNGNRGVVFATGTPVGNTMAELYSMQKYLQPDELKERGVYNFDAWASTFGDRETKMESTTTGEFKPVTRFANFINVPELMHIASQVIDVQRAANLKKPDGSPVVVRPNRHDHTVKSPASDGVKAMMQSLVTRAQKCKGARPEKGADNMAVICSDGRKGTVDLRLLDKDAPDDPNSKANQCVQNVLSIHNKRPDVTQMIFSNVGVHKNEDTGFHLYQDVIDKLVRGGIPRNRIADFSQLEGDKRQDAQEAMKRGDILVAIGSTEKLGTGVNAQNKLAALHHLDVPWMPSEIEQRDGRGWRSGNLNDPTKKLPNGKIDAAAQNVDIYRYVQEGGMDAFSWGVVGRKAHFISQVVNNKDSTIRRIGDEDTETFSPEQLMAIASGDERILKQVQLSSDVKELKSLESRHVREQSKLHDKVKEIQKKIELNKQEAANLQNDVEHLAKTKDDKFQIKIGEATHDERKAADEALANRIKSFYEIPSYQRKSKDQHLGEHRGWKISIPKQHADYYGSEPPSFLTLDLVSPTGTVRSVSPSMASIEAFMRRVPRDLEFAKNSHGYLLKDLETVKSSIGKEFRRKQELAEKTAELRALEKELSGKGEATTEKPEKSELTEGTTPNAKYRRSQSLTKPIYVLPFLPIQKLTPAERISRARAAANGCFIQRYCRR